MTCEKCHKGTAHNQVRNALHLVMEELGPLAGLCYTREDVRLQARNLSPRFPRKRPADVAAALHQHHRSEVVRCPCHTFGTDVNILKFATLSNCGDRDSAVAQAMSRHQFGERGKLKGRSKFDTFWQRKVLAEDYVEDLLDNGVLLSAFTVCPLGSVGPMGMGLLYGTPHPGRPKGARALKPNAQRAWDLATGPHAPSNLLGRANLAWASMNKTPAFFGQSYHSATPQAWAEQILGFNIMHALAAHIKRAVDQTTAGIFPHASRGYTAGQDMRPYCTRTASRTHPFRSSGGSRPAEGTSDTFFRLQQQQ